MSSLEPEPSASSLESPWPSADAAASWLKTARATLWPYALFSLLFVLFWWAGDFYLPYRASTPLFRFEYPLALYVFFAAFQILKPSRWRLPLALLAVFGPYAAHDVYLYFFGDVPEIVAVKEIPELFIVLDWRGKLGLLALAGASVYVLIFLVRYSWRSLAVALPGLLVVAATLLAPASVKEGIDSGVLWINPWLKADNAIINGRFTIAIYNEAKRRIALSTLTTYEFNPEQQAYYDGLVAYLKERVRGDRPVFVIVLESFLDARGIKGMRGRNDIFDPNFLRRYDKAWGYSVAPTFGGGTARSELEILCGIPALAEFDSFDFNLFRGRPVNCMPEILDRVGYETIASDPYVPSFFNAQRAYTGMGFREIYFAQELSGRPSYLHVKDRETYLFDGELFSQHRGFLDKRQGSNRFFSYLLTMYGHMPFEVQRPIRVKVKIDEGMLERAVNQSYYRSGPLAEQIQWLTERYPQSLVIAIADHLPVLRTGPDNYLKLGYLDNVKDSFYRNRVLVVRDGKPVKYPVLHHFSIPDLVYDYLTDGAYCKDYDCILYPYDKEKLRARYRYLMANAVHAPNRS